MSPNFSPGSDEAIKAGCICSFDINYHGAGQYYRGKIKYTITDDCPLHGIKCKPKEDK